MRNRLLEWMRAREDPLLDGPVPEPPGAWSNDPARSSPDDPAGATEVEQRASQPVHQLEAFAPRAASAGQVAARQVSRSGSAADE